MSRLEERVVVGCPAADAEDHVERFFRSHAKEQARATLDLRVRVTVPHFPAPLILHRFVIATLEPQPNPRDGRRRYRVRWVPGSPGPFPLFAGELAVEQTRQYDGSALRLSGEYAPPLGAVGLGFDAVVGNRIARATARDLLERLKTDIERECA